MSDTPKVEPLLTAAQQLDDELKRFGKLVDAACRGQIGGQKEIERTAAAIQEATAAVGLIEQKAQALVRSLQSAQMSQQAPIDRLRARAELLQQRHEQHETLRARFRDLGAEAAALTQVAQHLSTSMESASLEVDVAAPMQTLKDRIEQARQGARGLMQDARKESFEELAREVHSFEQILATLERKINDTERTMLVLKAQGNS